VSLLLPLLLLHVEYLLVLADQLPLKNLRKPLFLQPDEVLLLYVDLLLLHSIHPQKEATKPWLLLPEEHSLLLDVLPPLDLYLLIKEMMQDVLLELLLFQVDLL